MENIIPLPQIFVEILLKIKKTGLPVKLLRGTCVTCKRNRSLIVSDQTIAGEGLGDFFKHLGRATAKAAKNVGKKVLNIPARALEIAANIGTAAASKNPKLHPKSLNLYIKGRVYIWGKFFIYI